MRFHIGNFRQELSLVPLVLQSNAGVSEATWCLIRLFKPLLEQRANLFLRQEPQLYSRFTPGSVVRESLRKLSPLLYDNLPDLLRRTEDDYAFKDAAWRLVVSQFDKDLRNRFPAWYDKLVTNYQVRLRVHAKFLLTSLGSDGESITEEVLRTTWKLVWLKAPLTDVLTDTGLIEKFLFDALRQICCERLYAHLSPLASKIIAKNLKRRLNDDAVNEAVSCFWIRLHRWVRKAGSKKHLCPHVPFVQMAENSVKDVRRQNVPEKAIKNNPSAKEKRVRCKTTGADFFNSLAGHVDGDDGIEEDRRWTQSRMTEKEKAIWDLRFGQKLSWNKVALALGIPKRTAQECLQRLVERLKGDVKGHG